MKNPSHRVLELGVARGSAFWWAMDRMILSIFTGGSVFNVGMAQNRKNMEKKLYGNGDQDCPEFIWCRCTVCFHNLYPGTDSGHRIPVWMMIFQVFHVMLGTQSFFCKIGATRVVAQIQGHYRLNLSSKIIHALPQYQPVQEIRSYWGTLVVQKLLQSREKTHISYLWTMKTHFANYSLEERYVKHFLENLGILCFLCHTFCIS